MLPTDGPRTWQPFAKSSTAMGRVTAPEKKAPDTIHRTPAVTPRVMKTLIKVISKGLGANTILNPKVEFKILV
jgi:hypothetical protein